MKIRFALTMFILGVTLFSCSPEKEEKKSPVAQESPELTFQKKLFERAMKFKDPYTGLSAANTILLMDSSKNSKKYLDTLAGLYAAIGMNNSASAVSDQILKSEPENIKMLEIKASGLMQQGKTEEANKVNMTLYKVTKKPRYLFKTAFMAIEAQKMDEAVKILNEIKTVPNYEKDSMEFQYGPQGQGNQLVPLNAAVIYLEAYMDIQKQKYPQAMQKFDQSLKIFPKFYKAQENLQILINGMKQQQAGGQQRQ